MIYIGSCVLCGSAAITRDDTASREYVRCLDCGTMVTPLMHLRKQIGRVSPTSVTEVAAISSPLLACPFCGEQPEYQPWAQGHAPEYHWPHQIVHNCKVIGCSICVRPLAKMPDTKESVFGMWNSRHANAGTERRAGEGA